VSTTYSNLETLTRILQVYLSAWVNIEHHVCYIVGDVFFYSFQALS